MKAYFIPSVPTFIPEAWKSDGTYTKENWPSDAVLLTEEETSEYWMVTPPDGKKLGVIDGKPAWIDIPPPTHEELIQTAEREKQRRIKAANDYINNKQWPGKAAIGRLKGEELAQYNLWLDYLDALEVVDISRAPDIDWPKPPASVEG